MRGLFVATAKQDALDKVIMDRTGGQLPRKDAAPATVTLTLTRVNALAGAGTVFAGTRGVTSAGTEFQLDSDIVFGASDLSMSAAATCTVTGPVGNVAADEITKFIEQPFDPLIVPTNADGAAGGTDVEDDIRYAARYFGFFPTIRRGVLSAIQFAALEVPGVEIASVTEVTNPDGMPAAMVQLIVGDADGNATSTMLQRVRDALLDARAAGIPVLVSGGTVTFEPVSWAGLQYESGIDSIQAQQNIRAITVAVAQFLNPGQTLFRSTLISAAKTVPGVIVGDAALVVPAGDIVPATIETVIRIDPNQVTFS